ncbi:phenylalanine--tRNA ligase subunit beta [Salinibacterium sp. NK8237]|uniref:phenylalanine--tRNA ligase subunit beta n=1 Tax=Salinibacterium sp. NK8237 TaxID=2792038 RepID=UPI0018CEAE29|nr:phenylalanine--tRNA ligase subunit beta [Salinibacterium sp. NK8237]MBH0131605.1 phenylalanine--tRNA ligase subunit beta [Salinibacterium sp. NK8237]
MKIPMSWLREFVEIPTDITHEQVHAALVKVGFEEEDVHGFDISGPVVVGQVLEFVGEPQSNGKTINWCQVDVGEAEPRGIVCGAHNFVVGDKVVVTLPGSVLPGPFPIAARKTYGHVSDGMIASTRELGLGDEHDGILVLSTLGLDPEVGTSAIELLGLDDFAVEINVTPDRGYAMSLRGVAREYALSTGAKFTDPADAPTITEASGFPVVIADDAPIRGRAGVRAFVTRVVRNVDVTKPTPSWMITRLTLAGIRSISLTVDITNYVMLELGQPIHAYDLDRVSGGLTVRRAKAGETLTTLDDKSRTLNPEDLLITDDSGPIGLAGVMGGASTEITDASTNVLIEAANFEPISIARTARRHKLGSEASRRFERGVDPLVAPAAAARVVELLVELGGGTVDTLGSNLLAEHTPDAVDLPEGYAEGLIGVRYSADEITDSLQAIGADVAVTDTGWSVTPPSWRPDLGDKTTLVEEVARIVGYDRIPAVLPVAPPGRGLTRAQRLRRTVSNSLAASGLTEVLAYPFISQHSNDLFGSPEAGGATTIKLANALDPDAATLRRSLLPGLAAIAHRNVSRGLTDLALFEVGTVFLPEAGHRYGSTSLPLGYELPSDAALAELRSSIPEQPWHVAALFLGDAVTRQPGQQALSRGLADALATVQHLAATLSVEIDVVAGSHQAMHPGRTAELRVGDHTVGYAGELLPALALELDLPRVVAVLELDLAVLIASAAEDIAATPIISYPAATQDLSLVVPATVPAGELLAIIREGAGELLENVRLVDDYRGTGIPESHKSLTFALRFRASDRTLTQAEATEAKNAAVALAGERVGAELRE